MNSSDHRSSVQRNLLLGKKFQCLYSSLPDYTAHIPQDRNLIGYVLSNNTMTYYQLLQERVTEKLQLGGTIQKAVRWYVAMSTDHLVWVVSVVFSKQCSSISLEVWGEIMKTCTQDSLSEPNFASCKCKAKAVYSVPGDVEIQNVVFDIKDPQEVDRIELAQDRDRWQAVMHAIMNLRSP
jgi:hypothetical protein